MKRLLVSSIFAVLQAWPQASAADESAAAGTRRSGPYYLREHQAFGGSPGNDVVAGPSPYPLHKRFEDFTAQEKNAFRAFYTEMPNEDEPPFPKRGMRDIVVQVGRLASQLEIEGDLTMFISVGSDGKADGFSILSAPSPEMAKAVAFIFYKTDFKPAICGGKACPGEFPFRIRLER